MTVRAGGAERVGSLAVAALIAVAVASAPVPVDAGGGARSRASVSAAYTSVYAPAQATGAGWTGSVESCDPGTESEASQQATLDSINYVRSLAGLDAVRLDPRLSAKALQAALVYQANRALSHDIPTGWTCSTADAREAGAHSDIALGLSGAQAITGYMDDPGSTNTAVGHRRWILNPAASVMGTGSTSGANALWVIGDSAKKYANPAWVEWPTAGYFPSQLEPDGRWSISGQTGKRYSFAKAKVSVKDASGRSLSLKKYGEVDGYASDTLVFQVKGVSKPKAGATKKYTVRVTGIKKGGRTVSHAYSVMLITPSVSSTSNSGSDNASVAGLTVTGSQGLTAVAGNLLTATATTRGSVSFQWARDGVAIPGATGASYLLTEDDLGHTVSVTVTATLDFSSARQTWSLRFG